MNGLSISMAIVAAALAAVPATAAQTPAASDPSHPAAAEPAPGTAKPPPGHGAPGKPAKPAGKSAKTPVVAAPTNAHAQKVAPAAPGGEAAGAEAAKTAPPANGPEPPKLGSSGLPLPRWASLRADEVNLRSGPGTRYPIEWVYHRRDLPVQIEREFEGWRLIEDPDGVKGWVHQATLTGRRSFVVTGGERVLRRSAAEDAAPVAVLKPGVVGRIRPCEAHAAWCEMQVGDYRGYLRRGEVYGVYSDEAVN
jgi:SH3-like domain-containing protein